MGSTPEANAVHQTSGRSTGAGRAWSAFVLLAGCGALVTGALAATGDALDPRVTRITAELAETGVSPAALAMAGGIVFCVGTMLASLSSLRRGIARTGEPEPVLEELVTQVLAHRQDATRILQETQAVGESARKLLAGSQEQAPGHHDEAAFRLAASVDQLGAGLGEHMSSHGTQAEQRFDAVDHVLERICEQLVELRAELGEVRAAGERLATDLEPRHGREQGALETDGREPADREEVAWGEGWDEQVGSERVCDVPRGSSNGVLPAHQDEDPLEPEELEIVVTLEEQPEDSEAPAHAACEGSLGLLDDIDEYGEYHAPDKAPAEAESAAEGEPQPAESSVDHQLAELRSLLSEAELREVLDGFRRGAEDRLG
ncbi:MAG: hypothetical protein QF903_07215 [Planctomycetota bacterium]|jgi:hypothetical protein|nr:hypothetical protein [Planctomycetota bacterium]MDP6762129.1 hypothetical protein [Planctomycetota bacterium]MDP6989254.1 hypothetical protein [Planctomycetota bacterium]